MNNMSLVFHSFHPETLGKHYVFQIDDDFSCECFHHQVDGTMLSEAVQLINHGNLKGPPQCHPPKK